MSLLPGSRVYSSRKSHQDATAASLAKSSASSRRPGREQASQVQRGGADASLWVQNPAGRAVSKAVQMKKGIPKKGVE